MADKEEKIYKGVYGLTCNRSACTTKQPANWYNHSTRLYYCKSCAMMINDVNRADAHRLFGHELCTEGAVKLRDSFIFYRSFFESISSLSDADKLKIYEAIAEYSLNNKLIDLHGVSSGFFTLIKPLLDANNKRYINGTKAKRKQNGSKVKASKKQEVSKTEGNVYVNDNVDVDNNVNENVNNIIAHLNRVCGSSFRSNTAGTIKHIAARLAEGFTEDELCLVVDYQHKQWANTNMKEYLRPSTLFNSEKFQGYLSNAKVSTPTPKQQRDDSW